MVTQPLVQVDTPCIRFCQKADCSGITMQISDGDYFPWYNITSVTLNLTSGTATSGDVDITDDIIEPITGTVFYTALDHTIVGFGTDFINELEAGDWITFLNFPTYKIQVFSVTDSQNLETVQMCYYTSPAPTDAAIINTEYEIDPSFIGSTGTVFPDGNYTATVTITATIDGVDTTFEIEVDFTVICSNFCCIYNKLSELADQCDDCMSDVNMKNVVELLFAWGLLEGYINASYCGDTTSAAVLSTKIDEICDSTPCQNC